jgi:hypothetical protein
MKAMIVYTWHSGDVVKITRESGTIKMWDNDVSSDDVWYNL